MAALAGSSAPLAVSPGEGGLGYAFHIILLVPSSHHVLLLKLKNKVGFAQAGTPQWVVTAEGIVSGWQSCRRRGVNGVFLEGP